MGKALLIIGFILIAFVAVTLWRANAREAAAEKAYPPEGQTIEVKGNFMFYSAPRRHRLTAVGNH